MFVNRGRISGKPIDEDWDAGHYGQDDLTRLYKGKPHESHKQNFFRTIREGGLPVSDVYSHLQAMNTCHLCTIAARTGRKIKWDPKTETNYWRRDGQFICVHGPRVQDMKSRA